LAHVMALTLAGRIAGDATAQAIRHSPRPPCGSGDAAPAAERHPAIRACPSHATGARAGSIFWDVKPSIWETHEP
ncbi:hypothetical protein AB0J22_28995, partial [Nonomuraea dietziae]